MPSTSLRATLVVTMALLAPTVVACSSDSSAVVTTFATTTTARPTTTAAPTTVAASTTTTEPLPVPQAIPADGTEPVLELGTMEIPKIKVTEQLFEGVTESTLDHGPGHWPGTAMPGHLGNVVIGGHRTSHTAPFRYINELAVGDQVIFTMPDGRYVYVVDRTEIVTPDATWIVDQTRDKTATLFACHPLHSTTHRIVVFLKLVE